MLAIHGRGGNPAVFGTVLGGDLGTKLAGVGFRIIAPNWTGTPAGGEAEIAALVAWARETGASKVSLRGHSFGADLAARLAQQNAHGTYNTLVLLAMTSGRGIALSKTKKLFVVGEGDTLSMHARKLAEESNGPKRSVVLPGSGHMIFSLSNATFLLHEAIIEMLARE